MALGILECGDFFVDDHKLDNVPGTGLLSAKSKQLTADETRGLKHATGKNSHIVLMPQPSDDPRDPLNWPRWEKEACFWTLVFTASIANALWGFAAPAYTQLAKQYNMSVDEVASSFSANGPTLAAFTLVQNAFAVKYGHRIVYVVSTLVLFVSCIWSALSQDLGSLRASRIVTGLGEASLQCLMVATIEHIFFVHERGTRASLWNLCHFACATIAGIINSYVVQTLSWQLGFWFMSIACGLCFMGALFFVPETTYNRRSFKPTKYDNRAVKDNVGQNKSQMSAIPDVEFHKVDCGRDDDQSSHLPTFLSRRKIFNGTFSDESLWKIFLRPFPLILSPMTLFIFLCYSVPIVLLTIMSICGSTIFTIEYGFNTAQIGLMNLTSLVGIFLAMLVTGPLNDRVVVWMSQHNRGIYEPEYRLVFMLSMLVGVAGFIGWAVGSDHHMPWIGSAACMTMLHFSMVISSGTAIAYLIDTHGVSAAHIIALLDFGKTMMSYGATFFANGLVLKHGIKPSLLILGGCQAGCWLISVVMYIFGKRVRSFHAILTFSQKPYQHPSLPNLWQNWWGQISSRSSEQVMKEF